MLKPKTRIRVLDVASGKGVNGTIKVVNPNGDFTLYGVELDDGRYASIPHTSFLHFMADVLIPYKNGKTIKMTII